jgi:hypothetical protein
MNRDVKEALGCGLLEQMTGNSVAQSFERQIRRGERFLAPAGFIFWAVLKYLKPVHDSQNEHEGRRQAKDLQSSVCEPQNLESLYMIMGASWT